MIEGAALSRLTGSELIGPLRDGTWSVESVVRRCLDRVALRDDAVRAWSHLDVDLVLGQARALDALPADRRGPLYGIPIGIKDIVLTADMPTQYNSPLHEGFHPRFDASCVSLVRQAGAVIFGKTDTVEFGATGRRARTHNPHAPGHTPGGSSSGSAAAVADGHVPLAIGTQTGGSMIRPASYCGVWALKATWGLVGHEGVRPYAPSLDTLGWFARSCSDLRLMLDVFDPVERSIEEPASLEGASIAVYRTPAWRRADRATRDALASAIATLKRAGVHVAPLDVPPDFATLPALQKLVMHAEGRSSLLAADRLHPDTLEPSLRDQARNKDGTTRAQLVAAYDRAARSRELFDAIAGRFDAVLAPSSVGTAPKGLADTGDFVFNGLWSLLHAPCINVPGWRGPDGLPVGLTLTGPRFSERRLLATAESFGRLLGL